MADSLLQMASELRNKPKRVSGDLGTHVAAGVSFEDNTPRASSSEFLSPTVIPTPTLSLTLTQPDEHDPNPNPNPNPNDNPNRTLTLILILDVTLTPTDRYPNPNPILDPHSA